MSPDTPELFSQPVSTAPAGATSEPSRQEILDRWPGDDDRPDATTLWRWLSQAVAAGIVRQEGAGLPRDPFRYWLPARAELLRTEGGSAEDQQAWNARCLAEAFARLDPTSVAEPTQPPPLPEKDPSAAPAVAAVPAETMPQAPAPLPDAGPQGASCAVPTAEVPPSPAGLPAAPEAPGCLPYPFNLLNPADVPDEVWRQARRGPNKPG
jgi:hypothetical protein